ncbi:zinc-dependent alcohol dehydrogenase family protein [Streptomyces misionensis]|uniref:zinc-dependent alcohol dehydrogenase family protein n=1 Tax=Streptomyces misionensis TaxID=67331 RepID=UPI00367BC1CC
MKAIQITEYGRSLDVLKLVDLPEPAEPSAGEVLVAVVYAPLNFHDLRFIDGALMRPPLPLVPGNEGVARVLRVGPGVGGLAEGDHVSLPLLSGSWRERLVIPASGLSPLPDADLKQLSMVGGNPPTAGVALTEYASLGEGDWIVQNCANGGVGRSLIALARKRGIKTVNIVRRPDVIDELKAIGADVVVLDGPDVAQRVRDQIGADTPLPVVVGGAAADQLLELASPGGTVAYYSNADGVPADAGGELATRKKLTVTKLFVGAFDRQTKLVPLVEEAAAMVAAGEIDVPVEAVYPLDQIDEAIHHLHRGGKILLKVDPFAQ